MLSTFFFLPFEKYLVYPLTLPIIFTIYSLLLLLYVKKSTCGGGELFFFRDVHRRTKKKVPQNAMRCYAWYIMSSFCPDIASCWFRLLDHFCCCCYCYFIHIQCRSFGRFFFCIFFFCCCRLQRPKAFFSLSLSLWVLCVVFYILLFFR